MDEGEKQQVRILFVTTTGRTEHPYDDPSVRYRCYYLAKELVRMGHTVDVIAKGPFESHYEELPEYDAYIFHRPSWTVKFYDVCQLMKDKIRIASFDDFIFDISVVKKMPRFKSGIASFGGTANSLAKFFEGAAQFDYFMASTDNLREQMIRVFGVDEHKAVTIYNSVPDEVIATSKLARMQQKYKKFTLGYFPGTASHDLDWEVFSHAIQDMKFDRPVDMLLVGPLNIDEVNPAIRIVRHDYVQFEELPFLMAQCQTIIAPLEDTIFNQAKSGLKFWESVLCGCRVLATPIPDINRFESPVLLKCRTAEEWRTNLDKVLCGELPEVTEQEICRVERQVHIRTQAGRLMQFLKNIAEKTA